MGNQEIIVDSFAGGGGASTGIEMALGRSPDFAINHDREALALHAANHPDTTHLSENIYKVDPMDVVGRRRVGLLWASPDCKHFSKAKGGAPVKRDIRDLAWTVVLWAKRVKPRVIILENVEEFQGWGPLLVTADGELMPDAARRGETFNEWVAALKSLGYAVEWRELRACDFGAPTTRKRLFVIARRDRLPIVWPAPTHSSAGTGGLLKYRTAADIIDWSIPCPSIYSTSEEIMEKYGIRAQRPLVPASLERIAKGLNRYVVETSDPFIVDMPDGVRVAAHIQRQFGASVGHRIDQPLATITAGGAGKSALVSAFLVKYYGVDQDPRLDEPLATVTTRDRFGLVMVSGEPYQIIDIGMRMLTPRELFKAQGFPPGYEIESGVFADGIRRPLTKTAQIRMCGNSVCPPIAAALVAANCADLSVDTHRAMEAA